YTLVVGVKGPPATGLVSEGYNKTTDVELTVLSADSDKYCMKADHASLGATDDWFLSSDVGAPSKTACT
ncbi:MAG: hypothetical protein ACRDJI_02020, partial [Actinomycetota bacterium]